MASSGVIWVLQDRGESYARWNGSDHVIPPSSEMVKFSPAACRILPSCSCTKVDEWPNPVSWTANSSSGRVIGTFDM